MGKIDLPTILTASLGNGYIATYSNTDSTSVFNNGRTIDYLSVNFPLAVENKTWSLNTESTFMKSEALRVGYVG